MRGGIEHGGRFFEELGVDFAHLERRAKVVNADVLDAWYDPSPRVLAALKDALPWLVRTSPPVRAEGVVAAIAEARGVPEACVVVGAGSSSLIFSALPRFVAPSCGAVVLDPSYGEYEFVLTRHLGVRVERVILDGSNEFVPDVRRVADAARGAHLLVMVNPNSPTGVGLTRDEMVELLDSLGADTVVWVDETYIDFLGTEHSLEPLVGSRRNLIVCKSMSKYYALSGLRCGYLVVPPCLRELLDEVVPPWPLGLPAQVAAVEALRDGQYYLQMAKETARLRSELASALAEIDGLRVYPSCANFLLVRSLEPRPAASEVVGRCAEESVHLRDCTSMSSRDFSRYIRVAVKDEASNARIVEAVRAAVQ
ncbi:MAG: histidinol-phosphate transaminase [Armatimonadota bacterium]